MAERSSLHFVDLFAGLGGFHVGLARLGHRCVLAAECDSGLRDCYTTNFGMTPHNDVRTLGVDGGRFIPVHDLLCGGFPCQPFSKAGEQKGLSCRKDGDLFGHILRILDLRHPEYLLLENVANLEKHHGGVTFMNMVKDLRARGYDVDHRVLSPFDYGDPQVRKRLFIVAARSGLSHFQWPATEKKKPHIGDVLQPSPDAREVSAHYNNCLGVWQEFISRLHAEEGRLPSFPIWSMEFGADYPIDRPALSWRTPVGLRKFRGSHGLPLGEKPASERLASLPSHALRSVGFPAWKQDFIRSNRALYERNRDWIEPWKQKILPFPSSLQKLEWNCKNELPDLKEHVLQFRASGIRVKRSCAAPTLIAMTSTQVPIVYDRTRSRFRYMTPRECSGLQGLGDLKQLPPETRAYRALGNAVNANLVRKIAENLCGPRIAAGGSVREAGTDVAGLFESLAVGNEADTAHARRGEGTRDDIAAEEPEARRRGLLVEGRT